MRHMKGSPLFRRAALLVAGAIVMALVAMPAIALAKTPHSTLSTTYRYMAKAKTFTIAGKITKSTHGKYITVEVRKPGRAFWTPVGTAKISAAGKWSLKFTPRLGGKFYVRARYGTTTAGLSRTASVTVRKGPGVKYTIKLASTTSTRDSGLFERIGPAFLAACPEYSLQALFVGSGDAMLKGGTGDADVLLVHSPAAEILFMSGRIGTTQYPHKGISRHSVMYNDFLIIGPTSNPAGLTMSDTAKQAFQKIADTGSKFISRDDNSGTNAKEKSIWSSLSPANPQTGKAWYSKLVGAQGMAVAVQTAGQLGAYTIADRATWLNLKALSSSGGLVELNSGDPAFFNQYSVMEVSHSKTAKEAPQAEGALDFSLWIRSAAAQKLIKSYGEYSYPGQKMFVPNAGLY